MSTQAFDAYYEALWKDRWGSFRSAFAQEKAEVTLSRSLGSSYTLDAASVVVPAALSLVSQGEVEGCAVDLCAAPGGKTLALSALLGSGWKIVANDISPDRVARMNAALNASLTPRCAEVCATRGNALALSITGASLFLLDAPCSSERHTLNSRSDLDKWSLQRPKHLAKQEKLLLRKALGMLKEGGVGVYSTCSINPSECDGVVESSVKNGAAEVLRPGLEEVLKVAMGICSTEDEVAFGAIFPERTNFGWWILPDTSSGAGPIYFSVLKKLGA